MLRTNTPFFELAAFESGEPGSNGWGVRAAPRASGENARDVYRGPGFVGGGWRELQCRRDNGGYWLSVAGIGEFLIASDAESIWQFAEEPGTSLERVTETILGPALALALALDGVWCLHASAVFLAGRTVAFLGESGTGKSTLAGWLSREGGEDAVRVADDILPIEAGENGLDSLPHFPQLKLPAEAQPALTVPERLPLDVVYVLGRPATGEKVNIRPLEGQAAALKLVRHTAASRLFAPDLLVKHLDFCLHAAATVPVRQLSFPLTQAALPSIRRAIVSDLG